LGRSRSYELAGQAGFVARQGGDIMAAFEPDARERTQSQASSEPNDALEWASTYTEAALRCGQNVPEIETALVNKGLSRRQATIAVDRYFNSQLAAERRTQRRAVWRTRLNRGLSLAAACIFVAAVASSKAGVKGVLPAAGAMLFPLVFIWFSESLGSYVGSSFSFGMGYMIRPTPGVFVAACGWILMLGVPLVVFLIVRKN
jgi:hypothetical protein